MNYLSLFSGVGGFELGIQRAFDNQQPSGSAQTGQAEPDEDMRQVQQRQTVSEMSWSARRERDTNQQNQLLTGDKPTALCIGYSEIDKYAIETYQNNWKGHHNYGSATTINERELPDFELLVGGFPCQAFSIAGKRRGFDEARGTLFFDIARILAHKRPRHFLLENVKGLLSHDGGKTIQTIAGVLTDLGYRIEWQVLNAKDFGVPQNRERIFIVGHLRGECAGQVFPIGTADQISVRVKPEAEKTYATALRAKQGGPDIDHTYITRQPLRYLDRNQKNMKGDYAFTVDASQTSGIAIDMTRRAADGHRVRKDGQLGTLDANYYKGMGNQERPGVKDGIRIRRLTPTECERLMSWPDGWTIGSDTQRYKQCGNGVVSNVVQAVIEKMMPCLA